MKRLLLLVLWMAVPLVVWSQANNYAFVIYAEGNDMSVYRNGELHSYDVVVDDVLGMPLLSGDLVQTDPGTYVEIQVMPARTVIKVAENTPFRIEALGGDGGGTFQMSYGRLRARVERIAGNERFEVRGHSAVAGVRGTDFGYDIIVEREALEELQTRVYCFEGSVEVSAVEPEPPAEPPAEQDVTDQPDADRSTSGQRLETPAQPAPRPILISANQMVAVVSEIAVPAQRDEDGTEPDGEVVPSSPPVPVRTVSLQQAEIKPEIQAFWVQRDFQETPIDPATVEQRFPGIKARVERLTVEQERYQELQRLRREGLLEETSLPLGHQESIAAEEPLRVREEPMQSDPALLQRLITPTDSSRSVRRTRQAGHWLTGLGVILSVGGGAYSHFVDGERLGNPVPSPAGAAMMTGATFVTGGIVSYLLSLFVAD